VIAKCVENTLARFEGGKINALHQFLSYPESKVKTGMTVLERVPYCYI
jgi:hypothetical protein